MVGQLVVPSRKLADKQWKNLIFVAVVCSIAEQGYFPKRKLNRHK